MHLTTFTKKVFPPSFNFPPLSLHFGLISQHFFCSSFQFQSQSCNRLRLLLLIYFSRHPFLLYIRREHKKICIALKKAQIKVKRFISNFSRVSLPSFERVVFKSIRDLITKEREFILRDSLSHSTSDTSNVPFCTYTRCRGSLSLGEIFSSSASSLFHLQLRDSRLKRKEGECEAQFTLHRENFFI